METKKVESLLLANSPWFSIVSCPIDDAYALCQELGKNSSKKIVVRVLDGSKAKSRESFFNESAIALEFPSYFGNNWDAFEECINDFDWLPGDSYLILIVNSDQILKNENTSEFENLLKILEDAAIEWSKRNDFNTTLMSSVSFNILFQVSKKKNDEMRSRLQNLKILFNVL